jgi:hypothetical protein
MLNRIWQFLFYKEINRLRKEAYDRGYKKGRKDEMNAWWKQQDAQAYRGDI